MTTATKVTIKKEHQTISLKDAIAYDMTLRGGEGAIHVGIIILMVFICFPLAIILVLINVCKAKTPIYHLTVHQKDGSIDKKVVKGDIHYKMTMEALEKNNIAKVEIL